MILVDLYGPGGPADSDEAFWTRCLDALAPGGCLANNWADFAVNPKVRPMADVARRRSAGPRSRADLRDPPRLPRQSRPIRSDRARHRRGSDHRCARALCPRSAISPTAAAGSSKTASSAPASRSPEFAARLTLPAHPFPPLPASGRSRSLSPLAGRGLG